MVNISIIMPLYNAERFLSETLESVLKQTYKDFELICINDASTDSTEEILRSFQDLDDRIVILSNQERAGAAVSRNKGMDRAVGRYMTFLDGDDIFDEEMLQLAYETIEKEDADIVMYEGLHVPSERIYEKRSVQRSPIFVDKYCRQPFSLKDCPPVTVMYWPARPWDKLCKRSFIVENQLKFQSLPSSNDVYFFSMALFLAQKMIFLEDNRVMVYARDHDTPTRISFYRDPMCAYTALRRLGEELYSRELLPMLLQYYYCKVFFDLAYVLSDLKIEEARAFYSFLSREGIHSLIALCNNYEVQIDAYIYNGLMRYQKEDFETDWYRSETVFKYYLYNNPIPVISMLQRAADNDLRVVLWGAGIDGSNFLYFIQCHGIQISDVVDMDVNKHGKMVCGYQIKPPYEVVEKAQIVLVTNYNVYRDVACKIGEDKEVINMKEMMESAFLEKY